MSASMAMRLLSDQSFVVSAWYLFFSALTFLVFARDKFSAQAKRWRTRESTLHLLALIGGWPGAWIAQQVLRHKAQKKSFRFVFWMTAIANSCALLSFMWVQQLLNS